MPDSIRTIQTVQYEFDDGTGERGSFTLDPSIPIENVTTPTGRPLPSDPEFEQQQSAGSNLNQLFQGLRQLNPEDAAYAAYGRGWAIKNGEPQEIILGIVDRATAGAYITAQSEWQNLPVESRQFHIDHIDAMMKLLQGVIRAIT